MTEEVRDGGIEDCTPAPYDARFRMHEYGGVCYAVHSGTLYFTNWRDQRIYRVAEHRRFRLRSASRSGSWCHENSQRSPRRDE